MVNPAPTLPSSVKALFDLTGRVAVITGGAGFLGLRFADALAEMGALPVLFDMGQAALDKGIATLAAAGRKAEAEVVDVCDPASIEKAGRAVQARHGRIDILINSEIGRAHV